MNYLKPIEGYYNTSILIGNKYMFLDSEKILLTISSTNCAEWCDVDPDRNIKLHLDNSEKTPLKHKKRLWTEATLNATESQSVTVNNERPRKKKKISSQKDKCLENEVDSVTVNEVDSITVNEGEDNGENQDEELFDQLFEHLFEFNIKEQDKNSQESDNQSDIYDNIEETDENALEISLRLHSYAKPMANVICRFCAKTTLEMKSLEIFANSTLQNKIKVCHPFLKIYKGDGLSQKLCMKCVEVLDGFYAYVNEVKQNNITLRNTVKLTRGNSNKPLEESINGTMDSDPDTLYINLEVQRQKRSFHCPFCPSHLVHKMSMIHHITKNHFYSAIEDNQDVQTCVNEDFVDLDGENEHNTITEDSHKDGNTETSTGNVISNEQEDEGKTRPIEATPHTDVLENKDGGSDNEENILNAAADNSHVKINMKNSGSKNDLVCRTCGIEFRTVQGKSKHEMVHVPPAKCYQCFICLEVFVNEMQVTNHFTFSHSTPITPELLQPVSCLTLYQCYACCSLFNKGKALETHKTSCQMIQKGLYKCFCSKQFNNTNQFLRHINYLHTTSTEDPLSQRPTCKIFTMCPRCPARKTYNNLLTHFMMMHPMEMMIDGKDKMLSKEKDHLEDLEDESRNDTVSGL